MVRDAQHSQAPQNVSETDTPSADDLRRFFSQPCNFVLAGSVPEHLDSLPTVMHEVAIWGRSNVGKSSLINAVMGRKALARASNTPGRTRQIIFFNLAEQLLFADLPGYGYAKAPKTDIKKWNAFIKYYLRGRQQLRCVLLLIDGRHGILAKDEEMMEFLDTMAVSYQIVLTKADQVRDGIEAMVAAVEAALKKHPAARPTALVTSAEKGEGIDEVRRLLMAYA